jgi:hypothetical protein
LYKNGFLKNSIEIDSGLKALEEATRHDNVFEHMKHQRFINKAVELFKPNVIKVRKNEQ